VLSVTVVGVEVTPVQCVPRVSGRHV